MTRDDIIRMAREAATEDGSVNRTDGKSVVIYAAKTNRFLERFAALVAATERKAIEPIVFGLCISDNNAQEIVNAIRERGNT